eukprot:11206908-Lingulodinium_polyedra.AAC.1
MSSLVLVSRLFYVVVVFVCAPPLVVVGAVLLLFVVVAVDVASGTQAKPAFRADADGCSFSWACASGCHVLFNALSPCA